MVDLLTMAIPFFLLGMGAEAIAGRIKKKKVFRGPDVVTDLSLGVAQLLMGILGGAVLAFGYTRLYEHRVADVDMNAWWAWPAILVGVDFFYYWFHRAAHRINIGWASHAPHHSSEDYNLAVALRQGPVQPFFSRSFYLPLALVGFPFEVFAVSSSVNTIFQFWVHTELVRRFPAPIEWLFNTPSHHRVHHGCNGRYIDRNHGGILIIWDRLFGTFQPELDDVPLVYGTVKPIATWNPFVVAVKPFWEIVKLMWDAPRLVDKLRAPFMPPEWVPAGVTREAIDVQPRAKFDLRPARGVGRYVTPMFIVTLVVLVLYLFVGASKMSNGMQVAAIVWLLVSFTSLGALLDGWRYARLFEAARILAAVPIILLLV